MVYMVPPVYVQLCKTLRTITVNIDLSLSLETVFSLLGWKFGNHWAAEFDINVDSGVSGFLEAKLFSKNRNWNKTKLLFLLLSLFIFYSSEKKRKKKPFLLSAAAGQIVDSVG
jgi:hypothetical protein